MAAVGVLAELHGLRKGQVGAVSCWGPEDGRVGAPSFLVDGLPTAAGKLVTEIELKYLARAGGADHPCRAKAVWGSLHGNPAEL